MAVLVDVIVPLATPVTYTYLLPDGAPQAIGLRVLVPLGKKKIYTGVICRVRESISNTAADAIKEVVGFPDERPLVTGEQLALWHWLAEYYMCTIGEVMKAALPAPLKPESETRLKLNMDYEAQSALPPKHQAVLDVLLDGKLHTLDEISRAVGTRSLLPVISALIDSGALLTEEKVTIKQQRNNGKNRVSQCGECGNEQAAELIQPHILTAVQQVAYNDILRSFESHNVSLLFGVTSSGKTDIYVHLISEHIALGQQVLYLVPEIALTTQLTDRLKQVFGDRLCVYHSRLTESERTRIYRDVLEQRSYNVILGVRSALFLPFRSLGLVIVDEEHEPSYKQQDPAPRYHARDAAIVLASHFGAKTLLGTATPAVETYYNALAGKYGLVRLTERYKGLSLPSVRIIDLKQQYHRKQMYGHFSDPLFLRLKQTMMSGKQAILFQNRRGYSPYVECRQCGYVPKCVNCDVSMTLHNSSRREADGAAAKDTKGTLVCHYCGYTIPLPQVCPSCKTPGGLATMGFGTEKIEDEVSELLPEARVARMDLDTTRNKNSHQRIIKSFAERKIDVLVGTQMLTKGLHFDDVTLVGVLRADNLLNQPDFRATERTFHLLEQVAGRAGRNTGSGAQEGVAASTAIPTDAGTTESEVFIQTAAADHPVFEWVKNHDYEAFYQAQLHERKLFRYPPFYRLISINLRHHDKTRLETTARVLQERLRQCFGMRCSAIITPSISRVHNTYHRQLLLKIEREASLKKAKELLVDNIRNTLLLPQCKGTVVFCDVDPM